MNKRPIDKTKKSNIKCEHCMYYEKYFCVIYQTEKNYWNRCKNFKWAEGGNYK